MQADYLYDGDGNRVQQTDLTGATPVMMTYINDIVGLTQVLAATDGETQTVNLFGLGLIGQDDGNGFHALLADGLGSVRSEIVNDEVMATTTYDPFGTVLDERGHSSTGYGYTGEQFDDVTGLLYLRARYYNPGLHAFMGKDPWPGDSRQPQTMNGWSYVENNPLNRVDPTGRQAECPDGVCGPDATNWLMREMGQHFLYGAKIRNMKVQMLLTGLKTLTLRPVSLNTLAVEDPFTTIVREFGPSWLPLGRIPLLTSENVRLNVEALGALEFALYGLAIDYSVVQYLPKSTTCGTNGCDRFDLPNGTFRSLVTLCGHCIDSSDIGNMMFGLGGAARGYNWKSTWVSAATYNVLADWVGGFGLSGPSLEEAFFSADGKGAIPGHAIGASHAFLNPTLFCAVINNYRPMGYNDTVSLAQVSQCAACETGVVSGIGNKVGAPMEENPGSLKRLSDNHSTIERLESILHIPH